MARVAFLALVIAGLALAVVVASSAFSYEQVAARSVTIGVAADSTSYLALAAQSHACFLSQDGTTGKVSLSFGSATACNAAATGTGPNPGTGTKFSRYAFHDLLKVTNKGSKTVLLWANVTTDLAAGSALRVNKTAATGGMVDSGYYATDAASLTLTAGASAYVGVLVNTTASATTALSGAITIQGRT